MPALFLGDGAKPIIDMATGEMKVRRVAIAIGSGDDQQPAVNVAAAFAETCGADAVEFVFVHVGWKAGIPAFDIPYRKGWVWRTDVRSGPVVAELIHGARDANADVLVMATHGRDSVADLLQGSITERVVRQAHCPVIAVPVNP